MLMLIDTADPRYGGAPDPDEERKRRWEPIGLGMFLLVAGSISCIIAAGVTEPPVAYVLDAVAVVLCLCFVRASWPRRDGRTAERDMLDASGSQ